jgi:hypothetical protein
MYVLRAITIARLEHESASGSMGVAKAAPSATHNSYCAEARLVMNKECTACGWDGMMRRVACPTCKIEKWYCGDCGPGTRAFNCGECQQPQQADVNSYIASLPLLPEWEDIEF